MKPIDSHIFGPVPSRRLGLSLGIDIVPYKTCTYDCIYCQVGKTTKKIIECKEFFPVTVIANELERKLGSVSADVITFSGSGEPTLYSKIAELTAIIRDMTNKKIALLTNGSLIWRDDIRKKILGIDIIMPTITTVSYETFKIIHRPHPELDISRIIEGLIKLRKEYKGALYLELFLLAGINDNENELLAIKKVIDKISPDKIQLNTVVRPPSDKKALAVNRQKLIDIQNLMGQRSEIIAEKPIEAAYNSCKANTAHVLNMIKRRPVRDVDIANSLSIDMNEIQSIIKGLLIKGMIYKYEYRGEIYYKGRVRDEK